MTEPSRHWFLAGSLLLLASMGGAGAQDIYREPAAPPEAATPPVDQGAIPPPPLDSQYDQVPVPDRNRIIDAVGVLDNPLNPYKQSTLKGDRPIFGQDWFISLGAVLDTLYEPRSTPVPVDVVVANSYFSNDQFGRPRQTFFAETLIPTFSLIKGDTTFMPPDFEFTFTPAVKFTHLGVEEPGLVNIDPLKGTVRNAGFVGIQEAMIDYHLRNVSDRYDFDAIRLGIQPFNADFRGFLFQDDQLGVRLFGNRDNNRFQYNLAYFRRIEKDTDTGLNDLSQPLRRDNIVLANLFVQDLPTHGYTTEFSVIQNWNREGDFYYDKDGFLVRPPEFGFENPHKYNVTYFGLNGDGHFGRVNLTLSGYYALGNDSQNELSGQKSRIRAYFMAAEPSMDFDWIRVRGSFLYASGDKHPGSGTESGFDAISENPQFAGADTSYWIRQGIPLIGGGGVSLVGPNAVLPALRSSQDEGQSNFINPGLLLAGAGADFDVLPELRLSNNVNHLSFNNTTVLEMLRQQAPIHKTIGWDISGAATYRPFETQNVILRSSAAVLLPEQGFKDLYPSLGNDKVYYSVLVNAILTY